MTETDAEMQSLRAENKMLKSAISSYVESNKLCRFCKYLDADCTPTGKGCRPQWRGLNAENQIAKGYLRYSDVVTVLKEDYDLTVQLVER